MPNPPPLLQELLLLPAGLIYYFLLFCTRSSVTAPPSPLLPRRSLSPSFCTHFLPISTPPRPADIAKGCLAVMSNHTFDDLFDMMADNNIPALKQALNEGADVNMLHARVGSPNLAVD